VLLDHPLHLRHVGGVEVTAAGIVEVTVSEIGSDISIGHSLRGLFARPMIDRLSTA
jgi:hypothetical protein